MPISAPSAGTDAAYAPPANGRVLRLDYHGGDRGPLRVVQRQAAAPAEASNDAFGAAIPAGPAPAGETFAGSGQMPIGQVPGGQVYEGADALAALSRDLAGGGLLSLQEVAPPPPADIPVPDADPPAPEIQTSWRHDDIKGRHLGDRPVAESGESGVETWLFGEDGFGVDDLIDIVNPLQHIPIVSSLYRWITGDEIAPAASLAGGALFGGPIGMAGAAAGVAVEETTGRDLGGHAIAMMFGEDGAAAPADPAAAGDLASSPAAPNPQMATAAEAARPPAPEAAPARVFGEIPQSSQPAVRAPAVFIPSGIPASLPTVDRGPDTGETATRQRVGAEEPANGDSIAGQMMDALNKYEALVRARVGTAPSSRPAAGSLYDGTT